MAQRACKWSSMYWNVVSMLLSTLNVSWVFKVKTTLIIIWFQCWKSIVGSMLNNGWWWKLQLEFNHSSTLKHHAFVLINLLHCSFWHCLFKTCTLPESFQMLGFFFFRLLYFSWCFVLGSCLHIVTIVSHIYSFLFLIL